MRELRDEPSSIQGCGHALGLMLAGLRPAVSLAVRCSTEMADLVEVTQSALSRLEHREDNPIDVLRRYVEALGGELEVVAVLGNKRVKLLGV